MARSNLRSQGTGYSGGAPSGSGVRVVVTSETWQHQFPGSGSGARRSPAGERVTAWIVITLVFLSGGLALFDLYLLLSGLE